MVTQYIYFYQLKKKRGDTTFAEDLSLNYISLKVSNPVCLPIILVKLQNGLMAIVYRTIDSDCVTFRNLENERLNFAKNNMLKFVSFINPR